VDEKVPLTGFQRKYLRGLAHGLSPAVLVGRNGVTDQVLKELEDVFSRQELVKIRFVSVRDREEKALFLRRLEETSGAVTAGAVGHTAVLYREHREPEKRKIRFPGREEKGA
jgi:RNA-binding protein